MSNFVVHRTQVERVLNPHRPEGNDGSQLHLLSMPRLSSHDHNWNNISQRLRNIPSSPVQLLRDLPNTIIHVVEGVEDTITDLATLTDNVSREVVQLPHRASHQWKELIWVLGLLVLVPLLVVGMVFFLPLNSVNLGVSSNKSFLYGISTFYEGLYLIAWVETFNFALPEASTPSATKASIPISTRFTVWAMGLAFCKLVDATFAKDIALLPHSVFPIPFSILVSGMTSILLVIIPLLYCLAPKIRKGHGFQSLIKLIAVYWIALLLVTLWAVGVNRLRHRRVLQTVVGALYAPLRFVCKVFIASPVTSNQNPQKWIQLNLVVDMLFTRVQVATFPFIDSYVTLLVLFAAEILTLGWRYYNGVDRLALWWSTMRIAKKTRAWNELGLTWWQLTKGCFQAPILEVAELHLKLQQEQPEMKERILRTLTGDTGDSHSVHSDGMESVSLEPDTPRKRYKPMSLLDIETACGLVDEQILMSETSTTTVLMQNPPNSTHDHECSSVVAPALNDVDNPNHDNRKNRSILASTIFQQDEGPDLIDAANAFRMEQIHRNLSVHTASTTPSCRLLHEQYREQRILFHVVDSTGAIVLSTITRISQQLCITMVRHLPSSKHLNQSFQIDDERWTRAQIYGWLYVGLMIFLLSRLGFFFFRRIQGFEERKLSLARVMSYLFKDHFWFFFCWLLSSGVLVCASMVNHFGADFSFSFEWISCPDAMAWPTCVVES
ncbi:unnamed protein product [Cylindrotheca closterium]|uniref:Uncharacterized protein n=1 Tax=Cylindrotheca closterium TaxID=2856 RepID=A0AAD2JJ04_9STRA|nr:unnamed protein product [Cylindrotheca closterium]